jgi:hypothetical protein
MNTMNTMNLANAMNTQASTPVQPITITNAAGVDLAVDFTAVLDSIANSLPAGILVDLTLIGNKVVARYNVRVMHRGKRKAAGPFYSRTSAIMASITLRSGQPLSAQLSNDSVAALNSVLAAAHAAVTTVVNPASKANDALAAQVSALAPQSLVAILNEVASEGVGGASSSGASMSMQQLDDLMLETATPGYLFTGESTLEIVDPTSGAMHLITPEMQVAYNEWSFQQYVAAPAKDTPAKDNLEENNH